MESWGEDPHHWEDIIHPLLPTPPPSNSSLPLPYKLTFQLVIFLPQTLASFSAVYRDKLLSLTEALPRPAFQGTLCHSTPPRSAVCVSAYALPLPSVPFFLTLVFRINFYSSLRTLSKIFLSFENRLPHFLPGGAPGH